MTADKAFNFQKENVFYHVTVRNNDSTINFFSPPLFIFESSKRGSVWPRAHVYLLLPVDSIWKCFTQMCWSAPCTQGRVATLSNRLWSMRESTLYAPLCSPLWFGQLLPSVSWFCRYLFANNDCERASFSQIMNMLTLPISDVRVFISITTPSNTGTLIDTLSIIAYF